MFNEALNNIKFLKQKFCKKKIFFNFVYAETIRTNFKIKRL